MQVIVGQKVLNLEEVFNVATRKNQVEVVIDNQLKAELATTVTPGSNNPDVEELPLFQDFQFDQRHARATLLVKLLQLLKLKKNAQKNTAEFIVRLLNNEGNVPVGVKALFELLKE